MWRNKQSDAVNKNQQHKIQRQGLINWKWIAAAKRIGEEIAEPQTTTGTQ
jgi:hypothetical protein